MFVLTSKYRNSIMGIGAILVLVHHYLTEVIGKPYKIGAIGVDLFMFTMGLGLYYSLFSLSEEKSFMKSLPVYFWRRFRRIVPVFAIFLVSWAMWKYSNGGFTEKDFWLNLSLTGFWTLPYGRYFNWFISGILFFYLISPIFFLTFYKPKVKLISMVALLFILSIIIYNLRKTDDGEITRTLIMVVRLIPLGFGMLFGAFCKQPPKKTEKIVLYVFITVLFIIGFFLHIMNNIQWNDSGFTYGMPWYGFGLMTPFICVAIAYFMELASKVTNLLYCFLNFFGDISFELYLTHIFVIENIMVNLKRKDNLWFSEPKNFIAAFVVSVLFAYVLSLFTKAINKKKKYHNSSV